MWLRWKLTSLIVAGIMVWPPSLSAQQPNPRPPSSPVIGFLTTASPSARGGEQIAAFHSGLQAAGFTEGQNVKIEYRWAGDDYARLRAQAAELVSLRVNVIVAAGGHVSALAAYEATKEIPISFTTVTDPVRTGLVKSLNLPGTNATGTAGLTSELDPKRLELLQKAKPSAALIGVLINPNRPGLESDARELQAAADKMDLRLEVQQAATDQEIERAFQMFASKRVDALLVAADPLFNNRRAQVLPLAAAHSLPAIYQWREFVTAGGLMSYGPSITEAYHQAGYNAGRMLKGTKPADIPVEQPRTFQFVINLKTARTLNLPITRELRVRATELVE
jgi:ABC-type uncharacterized transport system substrate-binding protein